MRGRNSGPGTGVTLESLAKELGVSVSTVSRAVNNQPGVSAETGDRIRALAKTRGFAPNVAAAQLRRRSAKTLAVVVPALDHWYFASVAAAAQERLAEDGYEMLVAVVSHPDGLERVVERAHPDYAEVDGLIMVDLNVSDEIVERMRSSQIAAVLIGRASPDFSSVMINDVEVGRMATAYLAGLGHRRIGLVKGLVENSYGFAVPARRREGYLQALAEFDLPHDADLEAGGNFSVEGGEEAVGEIFGGDDPPSAVFCMSDRMAFGAYTAITKLGLDIPGDVSLIGVDDHTLAQAAGISTVRQPVSDIGRKAAELALARIAGAEAVQHIVLPTSIISRQTTGANR